MVYTPTINDQIFVNPVSGGTLAPILQPVSLGQVLAIANPADGAQIIDTAITTVGAGTLTAAALVGGQITRSGSTAAYTDTTDTAVNIVAALPLLVVGGTFFIRIKNATAFTETIAAGTGVTLPPTVIIPGFSVGNYFATVTSATAITLTHMNTTPIADSIPSVVPSSTALTTVGAGTITAAGINGGFTTRSGSTAAFTDTTDTAANIIAGQPGLVNKIGTAFSYTYVNNTVAVATLTGGTGITVSGITAVPANSWAQYLITYTAAGTITMVGVEQGYFPSVGTFTANGASAVTVANAAFTAGSSVIITLKTVGGTVGAIPHLATVTPGTGFTVVGTASDTSVYNYEIRG